MANEFKHGSVGSQLSQAEWEGVGTHVIDSQAAGDIIYASSTSQLSRLGLGTAGKVLMTNSGASAPEWSAALTGVTSIYATDLIMGEDSQTAIDFGTANEIDFKVDNAARLTLTTGALYPVTNNQIDLGTSSLEFKDAFFDGTVTADAFAGPLTGNVTGNASGTAATVTTAAQTNITSLGTLTTLTVDNIIINGTNIGHTSDTDSIAIASDGVVTMNQIPVFSAGINVSGGSIAGTLSTASQTNITGVGTISAGTWQGTAIASGYIAADAITGAKIADDALDSEHYTDGSIDTAHLAADAVTGAKIADDAIDSEHYTDGSIDNAHIADDQIDSEHYADGSIDTAHIADNQVTAAKLADLARGSILIGNASAATAELTKGSANYVLTSDGTDIAWASSQAPSGAQTGITTILNTSAKIGRDTDNLVDFATTDNTLIFRASGANQIDLVDGVLAPVADSDIDLGTSSEYFKDAYIDKITTTGNIELGHATATTLSGSGGELSVEGNVVKKVGTENMWVPATAMTPTETNGCGSLTSVETASGNPDMIVLDFDKDSDEFAQFSVAMPKSWNEGTITFQAYWTSAGTNTGTVAWAMSGVSVGDNDAIDVSYGTTIVATAKAHSGTAEDLNISAVSGALTVANAAAGELTFFEIFRDVSADDKTGDARLIGVKIIYTTDTSTDA